MHAQLVEHQAQEDLRVAAKYARGDSLTDEELITLSYFAVRSGIATPEQQQVVRSAEVVKMCRAKLTEAQADAKRA